MFNTVMFNVAKYNTVLPSVIGAAVIQIVTVTAEVPSISTQLARKMTSRNLQPKEIS